jgi:hypothetical protein
VAKPTPSTGSGSLLTGAFTAAALAIQTGLAAVVGVVLAREFGRGALTDGFFAAYGVFVVVVLAASAIRVTLLPSFARARLDRRLGAEVTRFFTALALLAIPLLVLGIVFARPLADVLTGHGPEVARSTASEALPWMLLAATFQLFAGLAASALAALDDYVTAAGGYALGSTVGLGVILWRVGPDGVQAISWGMAINGALALGVPAVALVLRAGKEQMPARAMRPTGGSLGSRLGIMGTGVALPLALQVVYVVCLPFAAREGEGAVTSFGFAYLIAAAIVSVTASSLSLVTAVPLTRAGLDPARTARHIVSSSWIALVVIGAAAGVFGIAAGRIADFLLGSTYSSGVGEELGRLVLLFSLWGIASIGVSVAFPLIFVVGLGRTLPWIAGAIVLAHVPVAFGAGRLFGLSGLALSMAVTTAVVLAALLSELGALRTTMPGLLGAAVLVALLAALSFVPPALLLPKTAAALAGVLFYAAAVAVVRPAGLRRAWLYLRELR